MNKKKLQEKIDKLIPRLIYFLFPISFCLGALYYILKKL